MQEPERKPLASPEARTKKILALLLLPIITALAAACGGGDVSSVPGGGAPAPDPDEVRSATPATAEDDGAETAAQARQNAAVASGSAERFGLGPAEGPKQGSAPPSRPEPPDRAPVAEAPPRAGSAPAAQPEPLEPSAPHPSSAPPASSAPAEPPRAAAPETARPEPDETATPADEAPPAQGQGDDPVEKPPATAPENPRPESAITAAPVEDPPGPAVRQAPASDEPVAAAPSDTTMHLSVPALGLSGAPVVSDSSKEAMNNGVIHVPGTGFPWLPPGEEGSNTYLAAHRIGYPGTGSDRVFYDLPALAVGDEVTLTDSNGTTYEYRVSEAVEVTPYDTWVANPLPGRDVVTLQTCIEDFGDHWGEGPDWAARYVVRADRVS